MINGRQSLLYVKIKGDKGKDVPTNCFLLEEPGALGKGQFEV